MKLILEQSDDVEVLVEETGGKKSYFIAGPYLQAETVNRNKRMYKKNILETQVTAFQKMIEQKRSLGELNHPESPQINPERASHLVTELKWDNNNVLGKAKILETPCGRIVKALLDEGVKLGVSTRGLGSVKMNENGINEVQSDFVLSTIDIVSDPSGPECFVNGIMENANWIFTPQGWVVAEQMQELVKTKTIKEIEQLAPELLERFLKSLVEDMRKPFAGFAASKPAPKPAPATPAAAAPASSAPKPFAANSYHDILSRHGYKKVSEMGGVHTYQNGSEPMMAQHNGREWNINHHNGNGIAKGAGTETLAKKLVDLDSTD